MVLAAFLFGGCEKAEIENEDDQDTKATFAVKGIVYEFNSDDQLEVKSRVVLKNKRIVNDTDEPIEWQGDLSGILITSSQFLDLDADVVIANDLPFKTKIPDMSNGVVTFDQTTPGLWTYSKGREENSTNKVITCVVPPRSTLTVNVYCNVYNVSMTYKAYLEEVSTLMGVTLKGKWHGTNVEFVEVLTEYSEVD